MRIPPSGLFSRDRHFRLTSMAHTYKDRKRERGLPAPVMVTVIGHLHLLSECSHATDPSRSILTTARPHLSVFPS